MAKDYKEKLLLQWLVVSMLISSPYKTKLVDIC